MSLKQSKNYDAQANIVENKLIIKNLKAKKFILDRYSQTLKSELDDFDNIQHIKESNWRLQELTFVVSNVLLPLLSLVLIISGHSETIILPLFISIAPRVSTSARIIANLILSYNEVLPIMDIYLSFFKKQESLDYWKETPKDCIIYISGTLPFVNKDVIDLKITERGLYTISGESGSGKTTILKLLSNLIDKPEDLTIKIKPNNKLEYVGIEPFYLDNTIKKNLMISTGKEEKFIINTVNMVSRVSGVKLNEKLNEESEQYYANYSDGQKRLINLCHILLSNSNIILLDEPTSNLDQKTKLKIIDLLIKLAETKVIICTTHDRDLMSVSKRIVKLDKGW